MPDEIDLEMLAEDIADMLGDHDYPLDACASDILPALPDFLAQVRANMVRDER